MSVEVSCPRPTPSRCGAHESGEPRPEKWSVRRLASGGSRMWLRSYPRRYCEKKSTWGEISGCNVSPQASVLLLLKGGGPIGETLRAPPLGNQSNCIFRSEFHVPSASLVSLTPLNKGEIHRRARRVRRGFIRFSLGSQRSLRCEDAFFR